MNTQIVKQYFDQYNCLYYYINIDPSVIEKIIKDHKDLFDQYPIVHSHYHVTLAHKYHAKQLPHVLKYLDDVFNTNKLDVDLILKKISYDEHAVAIEVEGGFKSNNTYPHITVARGSSSVKPIYSNEMLNKEHKTIDLGIKTSGKIEIFFQN